MPYLFDSWEGAEAQKRAADTSFLGAAMPEVAERVVKLELHCSSFTDPGADWCEFRAFDKDGVQIGSRRVNGY